MSKHLTSTETIEKEKEIYARLKSEMDEMFTQDDGNSAPIEIRMISVVYRNIGWGKPSRVEDDEPTQQLRHYNPDAPRPDSWGH